MSGQCTGWVLRHGPKDRAMRAVLIPIADAANRDGDHACPGTAAIIEGSLYAKRHVWNSIRRLIDEGWLEVEEEGVGRGHATIYRVLMGRPAGSVQPLHTSPGVKTAPQSAPIPIRSVQSDGPEVCNGEMGSVQSSPPAPSYTTVSPTVTANAFEHFWTAYPLHLDRKIAESAWAKAARKPTVTPELLISAALAYANDPNREDAYTKRAATWLNGECWTNDPLPPRPCTNGNGKRHEPAGFDAIRRVAMKHGLIDNNGGTNGRTDDQERRAVPAESRELRVAAGSADR